jgi:starvation-inducible outer membrane lipoprotein
MVNKILPKLVSILAIPLLSLFILSACVPIPEGLDQAATATQESTATTEPTSI